MRIWPRLLGLVVVVCLTDSRQAALAQVPSPLVGTWNFTFPNTNCVETTTFRPDGVRSFKSGEQEGESSYEIYAVPKFAGRFVLTDTITRSNGKPDCEGHVTPAGGKTNLKLMLSKSANELIFCADVATSCAGPFERNPPLPPEPPRSAMVARSLVISEAHNIGFTTVAAALAYVNTSDTFVRSPAGSGVSFQGRDKSTWTFTGKDDEAYPAVAMIVTVKNRDGVQVQISTLCEAAKERCEKFRNDLKTNVDRLYRSMAQ